MEYVYSAMLLHSAKKEITEASVKKVLEAAGVKPEESRIKALVASLKDINIEEAIAKAAVSAAPAAPAAQPGKAEAKKEEPEEDKGKTEEEAAQGLGALFG